MVTNEETDFQQKNVYRDPQSLTESLDLSLEKVKIRIDVAKIQAEEHKTHHWVRWCEPIW